MWWFVFVSELERVGKWLSLSVVVVFWWLFEVVSMICMDWLCFYWGWRVVGIERFCIVNGVVRWVWGYVEVSWRVDWLVLFDNCGFDVEFMMGFFEWRGVMVSWGLIFGFELFGRNGVSGDFGWWLNMMFWRIYLLVENLNFWIVYVVMGWVVGEWVGFEWWVMWVVFMVLYWDGILWNGVVLWDWGVSNWLICGGFGWWVEFLIGGCIVW